MEQTAEPQFEPPPARKRNWALITLIVVALGLVGVCATGGVLGYFWVQGTVSQGPPQFDTRIALQQISELDEGWTRYRVDGLDLEIELPTDMEKDTYLYEASDRLFLKSYFSFKGSLEEGSVAFDGFEFLLATLSTSTDLADWVREGFEGDSDWTDLKFNWERTQFAGGRAVRVHGSGKYREEFHAMEILSGFARGRQIQIEAYAGTRTRAAEILERILGSVKFPAK